jgi:hypothetical protein
VCCARCAKKLGIGCWHERACSALHLLSCQFLLAPHQAISLRYLNSLHCKCLISIQMSACIGPGMPVGFLFKSAGNHTENSIFWCMQGQLYRGIYLHPIRSAPCSDMSWACLEAGYMVKPMYVLILAVSMKVWRFQCRLPIQTCCLLPCLPANQFGAPPSLNCTSSGATYLW